MGRSLPRRGYSLGDRGIPTRHKDRGLSTLPMDRHHQAVKSFSFKNIFTNFKMQISSVSVSVKKYTLKVDNYVHVKVNILDIFLV